MKLRYKLGQHVQWKLYRGVYVIKAQHQHRRTARVWATYTIALPTSELEHEAFEEHLTSVNSETR